MAKTGIETVNAELAGFVSLVPSITTELEKPSNARALAALAAVSLAFGACAVARPSTPPPLPIGARITHAAPVSVVYPSAGHCSARTVR